MQPAPENPSAGGLSPGSLLRRKYRIVRVLGQGGMGTVLEAVHIDLERRVAIKVLHTELLDKTDLVERFVREGRAASRIEGDHVARVFDVDRLDDDTPFLVMEYLDGQDLSYVRRTRAPLLVREAIDYVLQACTAVAQAHAAGVIHRDIKPANLFLAAAPDGTRRIKVLDFGISKITSPLGTSEPSVTRTTLIMGSVEYMSPEQMLSTRNVDARTDIWALGVVLFELLTAAPPFSGDTVTQVCAHVMSQPPASLRSLRSDLPDALERVVMRCLEKDRTNRYANVEELAAALRAAASEGVGPPFAAESLSPTPVPPSHDTGAQPGATSLLPHSPTMVLPAGGTDTPPLSTSQARSADRGALTLHTGVGVASEPLSLPPKHRSPLRFIVFGLAAFGLLVAATALVRSRFNDISAASNVVPATALQPLSIRPSATASATATPAPTVVVQPAPATASENATKASPPGASSPSRKGAPRPTQPKTAAPAPSTKPSGID